MTLVISTTDTDAVSAEFLPTSDSVILQASGPGAVRIDVEGRVDADAEWSAVTTWMIRASAFCRLAALPRMRVRVRGNAAGASVVVRYG